MKKLSLKTGVLSLLALGCSMSVSAQASENDGTYQMTGGDWQLSVNRATGTTDISKNQVILLNQTQPSFKSGSTIYSGSQLTVKNIEGSDLNDKFGTGKQLQITSVTENESVTLVQRFYLYNERDYILTEFTIESAEELESNYMAPIVASGSSVFLETSGNRALFVPYDNDQWVRYKSENFGNTVTSYEVGALYNPDSRKGLVVGSVEHTMWKTGIVYTTTENAMTRLEVYGGITSSETRDNKEHGAVKGTKIKSPLVFIGYYNDWREGMETYADANAIVAPKLPWDQGVPFGWNSWGAIQTNLSKKNATEVADYFKDTLVPGGFSNDGTVYIGLDSYWDNITYTDLRSFARSCKTKGLKAGIYWTPFVDWAKDPNRTVEGSDNVKYKDIYLYANGQPQTIAGAYAIDPTHPATKTRAETYLKRFIDQGFEYIKLDFMTHGSLECDGHYDKTVYTGIQAYNQGLQHIIDFLDGKMYINLSIAPLFPANYAHSRRIACDAYKKMSETEYTLNSLTYGWWLDRVYSYNDADNMCFYGATVGENRARMTSGLVCGMFTVGDDFSSSGAAKAKELAETCLLNKEVIKLARNGRSFRPVEGAAGDAAADMFVQRVADTVYVAAFNYSIKVTQPLIDFDRLGLNKGTKYVVHEIWRDDISQKSDSWEESVPRYDVKLFKIYPGDLGSVDKTETGSGFLCYPNPCTDWLYVSNDGFEANYTILNASGQVVKEMSDSTGILSVADLEKGIYFLMSKTAEGKVNTATFIKR